MDVAALNNPDEVSKISEYLQYIGLSDNPVFASLSSVKSSPLSNWGQDAPPGGEGSCLVQQNGALYNASCDQKAYFACEERPLPNGVTTTIGPATSLEDAVLNFVGGKNILVPSQKATVPEAKSVCANQGLELMSLDSMAQMDSVKDFLGDIGLSTSTVLTSLKKVTDGGSNWLGDLASAFMPQKDPAKDGDCMGLNSLGITGISCDTVSNFVCQAPEPKSTKAPSPSLNDLFSAFMPTEKAKPIELGGQEYILPAEKATYEDAKKLCESRQMDLLSIQTKTESNLISSFLNSKGVGASPILTSLQSMDGGSFSWDGNTKADGLKWAKNQPSKGDCATLSGSTLKTVSCEAKSNFMCEAKPADSSTEAASISEETNAATDSQNDLTEIQSTKTNLKSSAQQTSAAATQSETLTSTFASSETTSTSTTSTTVSSSASTNDGSDSTTSALLSSSPTSTTETSTTETSTPLAVTTLTSTTSGAATSSAETSTITTTTSPPIISIKPAAAQYKFGQKITYFSNETATYDEATDKCNELGAQLMIAECYSEYNKFRNFAAASPDRENASYFIALKNVSNNWTNPSGAFHFPPNPINPASGGDCVVARNNSWFLAPCDQKHYYACETQANYTEVVYSKYGRYFVMRNLDVCLSEANVRCTEINANASVVLIDWPFEHSKEVLTLLTSLKLRKTPVYMNAVSINASKWIENNSDQVTWMSGYPNMTNGTCIGALEGQLVSVDCGSPRPFVCEIPNPPISVQTYYLGDRMVYMSNETATYDEATAKCGAMGMNFFIAECSREYQKLNDTINPSQDLLNASYLIALKMVNGTLRNPSGTIHDPPPGSISSSPSGGDCVMTQNGSWFFTPCTQKNYFVCEEKPNYTDVVYSSSGQYFVIRNLEGNCRADSMQHCAQIVPNAWLPLIDYPFKHAGEINTLLKSLHMQNSVVLMNRQGLNTSAWLYNSNNTNLTVWNAGHPNMSHGYCVAGQHGKLISVNCAVKMPFVCEIPRARRLDSYVKCLVAGWTCHISAYPIPYDYANTWCDTQDDGFNPFAGFGDFDATIIQLRNSTAQARLGYPGTLAIAARKINGTWKWRNGATVNYTLLNWNATPTTPGDCAGIDANYSYAVTFNCSESKRVFCI
ncbi:uncharacterized protein LOC132198339 [Neocloeon triangulifer]|uniref:uncharacterized protein LOC132198339 n=1 Tax=Neocloeon triangulifer TaxID=2078957 RepID=UPI00286F821C|nr:uncharacterized protein LOC132198339 [Neocloeon triangulifer]